MSPSYSQRTSRQAPRTTTEIKVAYHDACHIAHKRGGARSTPRSCSSRSRAAQPKECGFCGSAAIDNLFVARGRTSLGAQGRHSHRHRPDDIAPGNSGCTLQIDAQLTAAGKPDADLSPSEAGDVANAGPHAFHPCADLCVVGHDPDPSTWPNRVGSAGTRCDHRRSSAHTRRTARRHSRADELFFPSTR
jgi:hypothetical protein